MPERHEVERHVVEELTVVADLTRRGDMVAVDDLAGAGALRKEDGPHEDVRADRLSPNRSHCPDRPDGRDDEGDDKRLGRSATHVGWGLRRHLDGVPGPTMFTPLT